MRERGRKIKVMRSSGKGTTGQTRQQEIDGREQCGTADAHERQRDARRRTGKQDVDRHDKPTQEALHRTASPPVGSLRDAQDKHERAVGLSVKTNTWPPNGLAAKVACTTAAKPSKPLRISVWPATSHTRVPEAQADHVSAASEARCAVDAHRCRCVHAGTIAAKSSISMAGVEARPHDMGSHGPRQLGNGQPCSHRRHAWRRAQLLQPHPATQLVRVDACFKASPPPTHRACALAPHS
jgi:hypothetical protein